MIAQPKARKKEKKTNKMKKKKKKNRFDAVPLNMIVAEKLRFITKNFRFMFHSIITFFFIPVGIYHTNVTHDVYHNNDTIVGGVRVRGGVRGTVRF